MKFKPQIDIITLIILGLLTVSVFVLKSIAPAIFPQYFVYIVFAMLLYFLVRAIDFEVFLSFATIAYIISIALLVITLLIGQVTRGTIRWVPLGFITIQPSELVRPFLLLYFAKVFVESDKSLKSYLELGLIVILPIVLIFVQPSLGVAALTTFGFIGVIVSRGIRKKFILLSLVTSVIVGFALFFILKPYQKARLESFIYPSKDPTGSGYNSIQSVIAVGSGKVFGRGLGAGVQTQLKFLPEKQTDFVYAAIGEELGLVGSTYVSALIFTLLFLLLRKLTIAESRTARAYITSVFFVLFAETAVHALMNLGLFPITGVTLPFVSAGGSSLLGTSILVGIAAHTT